MHRRSLPIRTMLLPLAAGFLLAGIGAGWFRIHPHPSPWVRFHGLWMAAGFFGTLIALERAAAFARTPPRRWAYLAPVLIATGVGGLTLFHGANLALFLAELGVGLMLLSLAHGPLRGEALWMGLGGAALGWGLERWHAGHAAHAALLFQAFLILTVVGERLELARMFFPHRGRVLALWGIGGVYVFGVITLNPHAVGAGLLGMAAGLGWWDAPRRVFAQGGLYRYTALQMLLAYGWMGGVGILWLLGKASTLWDLTLHGIFLGFAFSMVFAHAFLILPAMVGRSPAFSRRFYLPSFLLHTGVLLRALGGRAYATGVSFTALAILLFAGMILHGLVSSGGSSRGNP